MHLRPPLRLAFVVALLAWFAPCEPTRAQFSKLVEKASIHVEVDRLSYEPDSSARLAALVDIESGWHINSNIPTFEYLIGTSLVVDLPSGWQMPVFTYPEGEMKSFGFTDQPISVYESQVAIFANFEIPRDATLGPHTINVELTYQACDDRSCLPPVTTAASVDLEVGLSGDPSESSAFSAPSETSGTGFNGTGSKGGANLAWMILLGVLGGLILNAMPCVLPVLSLKVFGLVKSAAQDRQAVVVGSLATSMGILLSFWALALAAILVKSAGGAVGWGVQFQQPVFVVILAIIVVLFCLNLWGIFEIGLPGRLAGLVDSGPKEGIPGHLASGLFATLMATPCSAPFLGSAVGFALSQQATTIFAIFTAIAIGMALPYLLLAVFPGAVRWLPKPGPWMNQLRVVLGFLLAAAAVWLFYVLAAQMSREDVAFVELGILGLALFIYLRHRVAKRWSGKLITVLGALLCIALAIGLAADADTNAEVLASEKTVGLIPWVTFDRHEAESQAQNGRLVFVDVTADWCFTCKVNERLVLETADVAATFEKFDVIPMKADWTNRSDAISQYLADHGRYGIPFYLLYRPGAEPHLFGELLTAENVIQVIEESASTTAR
jgi:suppressor for copper-sensitivity B